MLAKLLGMDVFPPAPNLSPEIVPVIDVENVSPENRFLGGEKLLISHAAIGATVGNLAAVHFFNPAGSGSVVVVERIDISNDAVAGVVTLNSGSTVGGSAATSRPRDMRLLSFSGANKGVAVINTDVPAAVGGVQIAAWFMAAPSIYSITVPFVLPPNSNAINNSVLTVWHTTVTTPIIRVTVYYRERVLFDTEEVT